MKRVQRAFLQSANLLSIHREGMMCDKCTQTCPACGQETPIRTMCQAEGCKNDATLIGWYEVNKDYNRLMRVCENHRFLLIGSKNK